MVRKSAGHIKGKNNLKFKNKNEKFKTKHKRDSFSIKEKRRNLNAHSKSQAKEEKNPKKFFRTKPGKSETNTSLKSEEDVSSSDSELDAFSQLVSCFTNTSKNASAVSDEDTETESELDDDGDDRNEDPAMIEDDLSVEDNSNDADSEDDREILTEIDMPCSKQISINYEDKVSSNCDPFEEHIQFDLDDTLYDAVSSVPQKCEEFIKNWPVLGQVKIVIPKPANDDSLTKKTTRIDEDVVYAKPGNIPRMIETISNSDWENLSLKSQIRGNILRANTKHTGSFLLGTEELTLFQKELFSIINNYQDLLYPERTLDNGEEVRFVYCLHTINHVLKTRLKVVHHNARLANKEDSKNEIPEEYRDQGLIRPKVLILVPFRNSAVRVVEMLISILLEEGNNNVLNKKRFYEEFTSGEIAMPRKNPKPEDYERTFAGDTDDNFKIGISLTKKSLKLYVDFYSADIIVASPLGLRVLVGAEGQANRDFDFLASIELLVLDQAEVILMQNWEHLLQVWDHLHLQPKESHGTNFARVRPWALSGRARYYRQTLLFCAHPLPQISALFSRKCYNYAGKVYVVNPVKTGTICQIVLQLPQVFNRVDCSSATESIDARFNYFVKKILPQFKESIMSHTVIYVPSYFDYVRIRNYFKKETVSFVQICEYSKDGKVARARDMFFHSSVHFLLYSERFHFFRRIRLKGIQHIIFYQPPTIPHFYSELCNLMQSGKQAEEGALSVSVLYTRYDAAQLAAIVGSERAGRMLASDRAVHMFMTGD